MSEEGDDCRKNKLTKLKDLVNRRREIERAGGVCGTGSVDAVDRKELFLKAAAEAAKAAEEAAAEEAAAVNIANGAAGVERARFGARDLTACGWKGIGPNSSWGKRGGGKSKRGKNRKSKQMKLRSKKYKGKCSKKTRRHRT